MGSNGITPDVHSKEISSFQISTGNELKPTNQRTPVAALLSGLSVDDFQSAIQSDSVLELRNYQQAIRVLMDQHFDIDRILLMHSTGVGKTITSLATTMHTMHEDHRNVFIIGFSRSVFKRELLNRPEFGVVSRDDIDRLKDLKQSVERFRSPIHISELNSMKRKMSAKLRPAKTAPGGVVEKGSVYFSGYQEILSKMFVRLKQHPGSKSADGIYATFSGVKDVEYAVKEGYLRHNRLFWESIQGAYVICDEIHNLYGSSGLNSWGICLKYLLDNSTCKAIFCSATPVNNSPHKLISLANLMSNGESYAASDIFINKNSGELSAQGRRIFDKVFKNKTSYLVDRTGSNYPELIVHGESISASTDGYLKFIRCKVSKLHEATMKSAVRADKAYAMRKKMRSRLGYANESQWEAAMRTTIDDSAGDDSARIGDLNDLDDEELLMEEFNDIPILDGPSRYLNDMVFPNGAGDGKDKIGLYLRSDINRVYAKETSQYISMGSKDSVCGKTLTGTFLTKQNLAKYSAKYAKFIDLIQSCDGKIFAYHNYVQVTGVCLIRNILRLNGWVEWGDDADMDSICGNCKKTQGQHTQISKEKSPACAFTPMRFFVVTGTVSKSEIDSILETYNSEQNVDGHVCKMILGSRAIKESYDLKAIRHMIILHQPENVSTFLQVIGRAVRNGSHLMLPMDKRKVNLYILVSSNSTSEKTFEEAKWIYKLRIYKEIQKINSMLLESAIDYDINFDKNSKNTSRKQTSPSVDSATKLYDNFSKRPMVKLTGKNTPVFEAWWASTHTDHARYIIKRLFVERSPIWRLSSLLDAVRNPPFRTEMDSSNISTQSFNLALDSLLHSHQQIPSVDSLNTYDQTTTRNESTHVVNSLLAPRAVAVKGFAASVMDPKITSMQSKDGIPMMLKARGDIIFMTPKHTNTRSSIGDTTPLSTFQMTRPRISVNKFIEGKHSTIFAVEMEDLLRSAAGLQIEQLGNLLLNSSVEFHRLALRRCVAVTNRFLLGMTPAKAFSANTTMWTDVGITSDTQLGKEYKDIESYRKLIYVYNKHRCIVWANYNHPNIAAAYKGKCRQSSKSEHTASSGSDFIASLNEELADSKSPEMVKDCASSSGMMVTLKFSNYYKYAKFWTKNTSTVNAWNFALPAGHMFDTNIEFINPQTNKWETSGIFLYGLSGHSKAMGFNAKAMADEWVDAGQVTGFLEKDRSGLGISFKLRLIDQTREKTMAKGIGRVDIRGLITGVNCAHMPKVDIDKVCQILKIPTIPKKRCACHAIRLKLIELELKERLKGTNKRYFYFHWEKQVPR